MTKNNLFLTFTFLYFIFVMVALFIYNLGEVTPKSSGIFPTQNVVLVCVTVCVNVVLIHCNSSYIPKILNLTLKKNLTLLMRFAT